MHFFDRWYLLVSLEVIYRRPLTVHVCGPDALYTHVPWRGTCPPSVQPMQGLLCWLTLVSVCVCRRIHPLDR